MNKDIANNKFIDNVLSEIENRRHQSYNNFCKSDLYTKEGILDIIDWYNNLVEAIKASPPIDFVSKIIIMDDDKMFHICYEYSKQPTTNIEIILLNND